MPGPAARLGDQTAHGGIIVAGFPQVLIGGMPAARLTDMHVCPMLNPGVPPPPHVGGPVSGPGVATVLIGNMPAATMGDMAVCAGPPDIIVIGCPTVIIGAAGAGSASAGVAGAGGAGAATAGANAAMFDNKESTTRIEHWVAFKFVDKAGLPVSGVPYEFTDAAGQVSQGVLRLDGTVRRDAMPSAGQCKVVLMSVQEAVWSKTTEKVGEPVDMEARTTGFNDGTKAVIQVFKRDITGPDVIVTEVETQVKGEAVKGSWTPPSPEDAEVIVPPEGAMTAEGAAEGYSGPDYYFDVLVGSCKTRSGMLRSEDYIEVEVVDEAGKPLADEEYILYLANGEVRKGTLDGSGKLREEGVPPGANKLRLPNLPDYEADV